MSLLLESEPEGSLLLLSTTPASPLILSINKFCCFFSNVYLALIHFAHLHCHHCGSVLFPQFPLHLLLPPHPPNIYFPYSSQKRLFLPRTHSGKRYASLLWLRLFLAAQPAARWMNQPRWLSKSVLCASLLVFSESLGYSNLSSKDPCTCCFFLLEILSLLFSFLILYPTYLNSNLFSSKKPFLASPYRNAIHQVFAIIAFVTFHLTPAFLSSFETLWCFQTG